MNRLRFVTFAMVFGFFAIWGRLFYWQVWSHERLQELADSQHSHRLEIPATRGDILSVDGTPLASNQTAYLVFAEKKQVKDELEFIELIAPILDEELASLSARMKTSDVWVSLAGQVEEERVKKLRTLQLEGLGFERDDKRYYPEASMAAHMLGFVGKNEDGEQQGYFGLEGQYDKELRGQKGYLRQERDAVGNPIVIGNSERIEPKNGRSLVLYLDKTVQFIAEEKLKEGLEKYGAKAGNVIVMEPSTGGIVASASFPSYDPGQYAEFPHEYYKNPVVADAYEPGSTFKPLIMAEAIDEKAIQPTDTFNEDGPVVVDGYTIKTWNSEYHDTISMGEILEYSSNVGMVFVSGKLGNKKLLSFINEAGFGKETNIDVQDEASGTLRHESEWRTIDFATASFGQGIAVTPIQMIAAVNAIANGGILYEPHMVKKIVDQNGDIIDIAPKEVRRLFSPLTANVMTEMMVSSAEHGDAKWTNLKEYRVAGKTGTAQIPVEGHYDAEKTIASFVGFAPAEDPKFVMLVTLREPQSSPWGSETAAPLFFNIARELLTYYGVSPK